MKINRYNRFLGAVLATAALPSLALAVTVPDATVTGDALVNGTLTVAPATTVTQTETPTATPGEPPSIRDNGDGTSTVFTRNSSVAVTQEQITAGGVVAQSNGDLTLNPQQVTTTDLGYNIYSQFTVDNATNTPISPTTYVAGYQDADGNIVTFAGVPVIQPDPLDPSTWTIDLADPLVPVGDITLATATETSEGDLQVGGDANVDGDLTVGGSIAGEGVDAGGERVTNVADGTDATDAVNKGQLDAEAAARIAADDVLQNNIDAEEAARIAADDVLQNNINAEAAIRASEDTSIRTEFRAADVTLQNNINAEAAIRASEDTSIRNEFRAADTSIRNDFAAADRRLQNQINSNRGQIDRNTRGIAMVAAMTNTTIQPGMKQAIDFNLAQFDDATGFAFGYGYRVNENLQINAAGGSTTDFDEAVARLGVSYQW